MNIINAMNFHNIRKHFLEISNLFSNLSTDIYQFIKRIISN